MHQGWERLEVTLEMTQGIVLSPAYRRVTESASGKPVHSANLSITRLHPNEFVVPGIGGSEHVRRGVL